MQGEVLKETPRVLLGNRWEESVRGLWVGHVNSFHIYGVCSTRSWVPMGSEEPRGAHLRSPQP